MSTQPTPVSTQPTPAITQGLESASGALGDGSPIVGITASASHRLGEWAAARDYRMRVESLKWCEPAAPFRREPDSSVLGLNVQIHATSSRSVPANTFYATLLDAKGHEYTSTLAGCPPALRAEVLQAGARAEGYISFEVPKNQHRFELLYTPQVIGPGIEELRFAVEP